jgi:hypothetical protein
MNWIAYTDMRLAKAEPETLGPCSICCKVVRASEMWETQNGDKNVRGWVVCAACHFLFADDPDDGWRIAQERWETFGPCKVEA